MVIGVKTKNRKSVSVQVDYVIHVREIKPWPPSQSLKSIKSALIQWEHGEKGSGSTNAVVPVPSSVSGAGDGKIEFNESFKLPVTFLRERNINIGDGDTFQKNLLEFSLYEPRRDKTVKGQLLASGVVDLAEYGIVKGTLSVNVPLNCKRAYGNISQPVLFLSIQGVDRNRSRPVSRDGLLREASLNSNYSESVSALMNEEYADEADTASFTDDDISSQSSIAAASSTSESNGRLMPGKENRAEAMNDFSGQAKDQEVVESNKKIANADKKLAPEPNGKLLNSSSCSSSMDLSFDLDSPGNSSNDRIFVSVQNKPDDLSLQSPLASIVYEETEKELNSNMSSTELGNPLEKVLEKPPNSERNTKSIAPETKVSTSNDDPKGNGTPVPNAGMLLPESGYEKEIKENGDCCTKVELLSRDVQDDTGMQDSEVANAPSSGVENLENCPNIDGSRNLKSVRLLTDSVKSNGSFRSGSGVRSFTSNGKKDAKISEKDTRSLHSDNKVLQLERKIKMLEGELREAAAIEVGLYSVVAEHGSSFNKVHAPARRLSRLYFHAAKENDKSRRGSAARSAVSGLVLVAKACGNDVPRLTFWLSNSIVLRATISEAARELYSEHFIKENGLKDSKKPSTFKWNNSSSSKSHGLSLHGSISDWEDPLTFTSALEKVEAWMFSRIVESVWWQTLTPYMQSAAANAIVRVVGSESSSASRRKSRSCHQEQAIASLELWKTAFMDACERICPVRAAGHECGCLPVLSRLVMEQLTARLDVAMFNAILRESADEVPTDPVSDPISDANVLPIPFGKACFGAGAQLKNAIGNWSRWLSDLFGIDDDDVVEDENDGDERKEYDASFKSFQLLNALSDLMMLPKDLLLSTSVRKEVCPMFGAPLIQRILYNFVPDEFCPDPIPKVVLEALDSEVPFEGGEDCVMSLPCAAAPVVYPTPSASSLARILEGSQTQSRLMRSGSSFLRKSYTSDDELEELNSPLASVVDSLRSPTNTTWKLKENGNQSSVRYQLLRDVWKNSD